MINPSEEQMSIPTSCEYGLPIASDRHLLYTECGGDHMAGPKAKPESEHYKTLNFTVPPQLAQALQDFSLSMGGRPRSRILQDALTEYLERHKDERPIWIKNE